MRRKKKKTPRLNLIPILDAIFIFIFFLLMSAQFIDIYQIGSDAPISASSDEHPKKEPLNLTLELTGKKIVVKTGMDANVFKSYTVNNLKQLNEGLIELKKMHPEENSAIIKPSSNFKYDKIIAVIDHTREIRKKDTYLTITDKSNQKKPSKVLFDKIIFETIN
jgi:biopolymer transport protein ExbD